MSTNTNKHDTLPIPLVLGETRVKEYGGGIKFHEVLLHVGPNAGNCVATIVLGGRGGTDPSKEAAEAFAKAVVQRVNSHDCLLSALQGLLTDIEAIHTHAGTARPTESTMRHLENKCIDILGTIRAAIQKAQS